MPESDARPGGVTVVVACIHPSPSRLRRCVLSVLQQTYDGCGLVLVSPTTQPSLVDDVLDWAGTYERVEVVRVAPEGGFSEALRCALGTVTTKWVALLHPDDWIEPEALALMLAATAGFPAADVVYADSDEVDSVGARVDRFDRPEWSPRRLQGHAYIDGLVVFDRSAIEAAGGARPGFDGAEIHDLLLRVTERGGDVIHLPRVLHHEEAAAKRPEPVPQSDRLSAEAGRRAVKDQLDRLGLAGTVRHAAEPGYYLTDLAPLPTLVSIVIPSRGGRRLVKGAERIMAVDAVRSIVAHRYSCDIEILVVHDTDADRGYLGALAGLAGERLRILDYDPPFNFSAKVNVGIHAAAGQVVVLLNDDVEVTTPRWLDQLAALAQQPDVGAVGALLLFEDGTVQHAGQCFNDGRIGHVAFKRPLTPGDHGSNIIDREVVGVTAAVLAQRRDVWEQLGGFDETLPNNFNDVDYCNRIRLKGFRIVQANSVQLFHFESKTRDTGAAPWEIRRIEDRLGDQLLANDPYTSARAADLPRTRRSFSHWARRARHVLRDELTGAPMLRAGNSRTGLN